MNSPAPKPAHTLQIAPEKLAGLYYSVASNLARTGLPPERRKKILAENITAVCVSCGLRLGGEELALLGPGQADPEPSRPKLERLRLGYCGRNGCESRLYDVHFTEHAPIDWNLMVEPVERPAAPQETTPAPDASRPGGTRSSKRVLRLVLVLAALFALVYVTLIYTEGRIPLVQPKHHYTVDPHSARPPGKASRP